MENQMDKSMENTRETSVMYGSVVGTVMCRLYKQENV